jgi:DNA invertase Pin-like site-specific DNA recombinase
MATCATFAAANGLSIVDVYVDTGVSGSVSPWAREGLSAALKRCEDEGLNLLVAKLDRLSRSVMDSLAVEKDLNRHELEVFSASEPNGKSPELELLRGIIRNFAQFERARCQSRIKEGLAAARAKGVRLGRPTAGFAKDELGRWVKSEDYRRVLLALAMRGEGRKLREIAAVTGWKAPMISKLVKRYQNVDGLEAYAAELGL